MFCTKSAKKEINKTNNHAMRVLYEDHDSSFGQFLEKDPGGEYSPYSSITGGPCQYSGPEILQENHIWGL